VTGPVLVVHGGAGLAAAQGDRARYLEAIEGALERGLAALARDATSAVLAAVCYMEAETELNAGRGATLDREGNVTLDAGFMDGRNLRFGGVAGVTRCMNPVLLAHRLSSDGDYGRLLGGAAADDLALRLSIAVCSPADLVTERAKDAYRRRAQRGIVAVPSDTVGAVALDGHGHLAAAVSTGGTSMKPAVVGAGFWADDRVGACVTTGVGEVLLRQGTARRAASLLAGGHEPEDAARHALAELKDSPDDVRGPAGLILVTRSGAVALDHSSPEMPAGYARPGVEARVALTWTKPLEAR
jgi:beta-aspartyl-peptidase (threonine type)